MLLFPSCAGLIEAPDREVPSFRAIWSKNFDPEYTSGNLPVTFSSPYIYDDLLFVGAPNGKMHAYELKSGRPLWESEDDESFNTRPAVWNEYVFYGATSGRFFARNARTGSLKYKVDLGNTIESRPVFAKDRIFLQLRNHALISLDAETGKILWNYRRSVSKTTTLQNVSSPLVVQNKLYVGTADGAVLCLQLETGELLWETNLSAPNRKFNDIDATPVLYDGKLYVAMSEGPLTMLNASTGELVGKTAYDSSLAPLFTRNSILIAKSSGQLVSLDRNWKPKQEFTFDGGIITDLKEWRDGVLVSTSKGSLFYLKSSQLSSHKYEKDHTEFHFASSQSALYGGIVESEKYIALYSSRNRLFIFR